MKFIIAMILLFALVIIVLTMLRSSGPRVTHIEHRREEDEVDRKDDDA